MKPIIGINLDVKNGPPPQAQIQANYYEVIQRAGGIPVLLPPMSDDDIEELLKGLSGIMLIGGPDYCPTKYGEEASHLVELCSAQRQEFDFRVIETTLNKTDLPILGICAGAQLLNIALGGSLIQDINSEFPDTKVVHTNDDGYHKNPHKHPVILQADSQLGRIYKKERLDVPTSHHQSVKKLGRGLTATAHAEDGIIEAVELDSRHFTLGVQWHPERDYAGNSELFVQFVQAAAKHTPKISKPVSSAK
ncbi:MAG TPA: gamma-glutamyl-gamma-aminobutyrate hydrolase family protein [Drouetiella sp.]